MHSSRARNGTHLVLLELALQVLELLLALLLERDDDEADEEVHHEEGHDHDVRDVEEGHLGARAVARALALLRRVDRVVQQPAASA